MSASHDDRPSEAPPPFRLTRAKVASAPLVVCSPHSGQHYPVAFLASSRLGLALLRRSEDAFVDRLFADAPALGAPLIAATHARSFLDVNREPYELDPAMFEGQLPTYVNTASPRVRSGFGTVPGQVAGAGAIYTDRMPFAEAERRLALLYRPYHEALGGLVLEAKAHHGFAIVLDCHSMPSTGVVLGDSRAGQLSDIVLGDRFGTSCGAAIVDGVERFLRRSGYRARRNDPYAGGFTTEYYGHPSNGVHALQIEINRALYMDEARHEPSAGFEALRADMARLVALLGDQALPALAAE
jgi:N-formylglutamate amidohydrolase